MIRHLFRSSVTPRVHKGGGCDKADSTARNQDFDVDVRIVVPQAV